MATSLSQKLLLLVTLVLCLTNCSGAPEQQADVDKRASIGASIGVKNGNWLFLIDLVPGGPAERSGIIRHGDRLIGIKPGPDADVIDVHDLTSQEVVDLIQGPKGSEITLRLMRKYSTFFVTLERDIVSVDRHNGDDSSGP